MEKDGQYWQYWEYIFRIEYTKINRPKQEKNNAKPTLDREIVFYPDSIANGHWILTTRHQMMEKWKKIYLAVEKKLNKTEQEDKFWNQTRPDQVRYQVGYMFRWFSVCVCFLWLI